MIVLIGVQEAFAQKKENLVVVNSSIKFENSKKKVADFNVNETQDTYH